MLTNLKSSFFDEDLNNSNYKIWCKESIKETFMPLSQKILIEGPLFKPSKSNILNLKQRYFVIFEDRLLYYKVIS